MSIQQAIVRLTLEGRDRVSNMLDKAGTNLGKLQNSFVGVGLQAKAAKQKVASFTKGFTDIRSAGLMVMGFAQSMQQAIERLNQLRLEGEKDVNVSRSLQFLIGDTTLAIQNAREATYGLVTGTDLEKIISRWSRLGIGVDDTAKALRVATMVALEQAVGIDSVAKALEGAIKGRTTSLVEYGVVVDGLGKGLGAFNAAVEATAATLQTKNVAFRPMARILRDSERDAVNLAHMTHAPLFQLAQQQVKIWEEDYDSAVKSLLAKGENRKAGLLSLLKPWRRMNAELDARERQAQSGATGDAEAIKIGEAALKKRNEILKAAAQQEKADQALLDVQKSINKSLDDTLLREQGRTALQIELMKVQKKAQELAKQKPQTVKSALLLEEQLTKVKAQQLKLMQKISAEAKMTEPVLKLLMKTAAGLGFAPWMDPALWEKPPKKQPKKKAAKSTSRPLRYVDQGPVQAESSALARLPVDFDEMHEIAKAVERLKLEITNYNTQIERLKKQREASYGDIAALKDIADQEATLIAEHNATKLQLMHDHEQAVKELQQDIWAEKQEKRAEMQAAEDANMRQHFSTFQSMLGTSDEAMSSNTKAARAVTAGAAALAANWEKAAKAGPGFISAIGQATTAQITNEKTRGMVMAGIVFADAIRAFVMPPNLGTDPSVLGWGALAAGLYGVAAMTTSPKAVSGTGGTKGQSAMAKPFQSTDAASQGFTVNFYSNAPIISGGTQQGASQLAGIAMSAVGTGMDSGGAV